MIDFAKCSSKKNIFYQGSGHLRETIKWSPKKVSISFNVTLDIYDYLHESKVQLWGQMSYKTEDLNKKPSQIIAINRKIAHVEKYLTLNQMTLQQLQSNIWRFFNFEYFDYFFKL